MLPCHNLFYTLPYCYKKRILFKFICEHKQKQVYSFNSLEILTMHSFKLGILFFTMSHIMSTSTPKYLCVITSLRPITFFQSISLYLFFVSAGISLTASPIISKFLTTPSTTNLFLAKLSYV